MCLRSLWCFIAREEAFPRLFSVQARSSLPPIAGSLVSRPGIQLVTTLCSVPMCFPDHASTPIRCKYHAVHAGIDGRHMQWLLSLVILKFVRVAPNFKATTTKIGMRYWVLLSFSRDPSFSLQGSPERAFGPPLEPLVAQQATFGVFDLAFKGMGGKKHGFGSPFL